MEDKARTFSFDGCFCVTGTDVDKAWDKLMDLSTQIEKKFAISFGFYDSYTETDPDTGEEIEHDH